MRLALTQAQLGIWMGHQRASDPSMYNCAEATSLIGPLCPERFEVAVRDTLARAKGLSAKYVEQRGAPVCIGAPLNSSAFEYSDLSAHKSPSLEAQSRMQRWLRAPLAIEQGQLVIHRLYRIGPSQYLWLHLAHHIALDGYAFQLVSRAIAHTYNTGKIGRGFGALSTVALEEEEYEVSEDRRLDEDFWCRGPGSQSEAVGLESYRSPLAGTSDEATRPRRLVLDLDKAFYQELKHFADSQKLSWANSLMALLAGFIAKHSGRTQLCFGLPVMLRLGTPSLNVPSMAMNINRLPVAVALHETPMDTARRIEKRLSLQRRHQRFRYEQLRSLLPAKVGFGPVLNALPFGALSRLGNCEARSHVLSAGPVEDLSIAMYPRGEGLRCDVDLHPEKYNAEAATALVRDLRQWLCDFVAHPTVPWGLGDESRSTTDAKAPQTMAQIEARAIAQPEALALVSEQGQWTYRELMLEARQIAGWLTAQGIEAGQLIAFDMPRSPQLIAWVLGTLYCGCGYLVVNAEQPAKRRARILEVCRPHLVLNALPEQNGQCASGLRATRAADPAYVVFTSGSSGEPKGVEVSHGALDHFVSAASERYGIDAADRVLQFASLAFDASVEEIFVTLCAGGCLVYREEGMLESVGEFLAQCHQKQLTVVDLPTAYWNEICWALAKGSCDWPNGVRTVIIGGEAAGRAQVDAFLGHAPEAQLLNTYGPSEATVVATVATLRATSGGNGNTLQEVPIGLPLRGLRAALVNEAGQVLRNVGCEGELVLAGPTLARGYLGRDDLTTERFVPVELDSGKPRVRCYRTGDLALRAADGQFFFRGRIDDEVKLSGHRVCPAEVEATLLQHPQVKACAVVVDRREQVVRLVAFVEVEVGLNEAQLTQYLIGELPAVMVPAAIVCAARLPRNVNGKLDRAELRVEATGRVQAHGAASESPQPEQLTESQAVIVQTWQQLLGGAAPHLDSDFFDVGGSSLQVIQLVNRLCAAGLELRVADVFAHSTPRRLALRAELVGQGLTAEASVPRSTAPWAEGQELPSSWFGQVRGTAPSAMERIVLTGATGFVGAHLLPELLEDKQVHVTCLVRGASDVRALDRLKSVLQHYGLQQVIDTKRLEVLACDLGSSDCQQLLLERIESCHAIVHSAAVVSLTRDYESLKRSNVEATRQLLQLAGRHGAYFHQVSTLAVVPQGQAAAPEQFVAVHPELLDGYQQSKWHSEYLCQNAAEQGLRVNVYRLGRVSGARRRPAIQEDDLIWRVARASVRAGVWPDLSTSEPWLPVDDGASLIAALRRCSLARNREGATFYNFAHNGEVHLARVHWALLQVGYDLQVLPLTEWLQRVRRHADAADQATLVFFERNATRNRPTPSFGGICSEGVRKDAPKGLLEPVEDCLLVNYCHAARKHWDSERNL